MTRSSNNQLLAIAAALGIISGFAFLVGLNAATIA